MEEMGRLSEKKEFAVKMKKNGEDLREVEGVGYGGFKKRNGGRERKCRVKKIK